MIDTVRKYASLVKFAHTIFAMPFAMIGFAYALANNNDAEVNILGLLVQTILCMVFARNTAMGFNRWADRRIDRANPRTAEREIPAGKVSSKQAMRFVVINALLFVATASTINLLTAVLSPVALIVILSYSYCKRLTSLSHLILGLSLGIAPVGAYVAVTGRFALEPCVLSLLVITWCGGFDIIYALQDVEFDRKHGLHSIPVRCGVRGAIAFSMVLHAVSIASAIWFATFCPQSWLLWCGIGIFVLLLIIQHVLVTPSRQKNIGIAFGTLNGLASVVLAAAVIIDLFVFGNNL